MAFSPRRFSDDETTSGGGGSISVASEDFRGRLLLDQSPPEPFFLFFLLRSARAHQFQSLRQDHSTVAQLSEATVAERSLTICVVARFPDKFPHYA